MLYRPSRYFNTPSCEKKLWRYMSIDKFMAMINDEELYFPKITLFNDQKEGKLSDKSKEKVHETHLLDVDNTPIKQDDEFKKYKDHILGDPEEINVRHIESDLRGRYYFDALLSEFSNHLMFCSCWFKSDTESHSMWAEYGDKSPTSIAIQTTVGDLIKSMKYCDDREYNIHIGAVNYIDYREDDIKGYENFSEIKLTNPNNVLKLFYAPVMHKRKIYKDEHEVRATISFESICNAHLDRVYTSEIPFYSDWLFEKDISLFDYNKKTHLMKEVPPYGIKIPINLKTLIKAVVMSPRYNDYFYDPLVKLIDRSGLDTIIVRGSEI